MINTHLSWLVSHEKVAIFDILGQITALVVLPDVARVSWYSRPPWGSLKLRGIFFNFQGHLTERRARG